MSDFDIGDVARITATFEVADTPTDPTTTTIRVRTPAGAETSHQYGVDGNVVRVSAGVFRYDLALTASGYWRYRWVGTGVAAAAEEKTIAVKSTAFENP